MDIFNLATVDFLSVVAYDVVEVVLVEIGEGEIIADFTVEVCLSKSRNLMFW